MSKKLIIELPEKVIEAIQNGDDYRYDIHTAIAQGMPVSNDGDLISREALKETIINICGNCSNIIREYKEGVPDGNCAIQHIMNMIDNAPTVHHPNCDNCEDKAMQYSLGFQDGYMNGKEKPKGGAE